MIRAEIGRLDRLFNSDYAIWQIQGRKSTNQSLNEMLLIEINKSLSWLRRHDISMKRAEQYKLFSILSDLHKFTPESDVEVKKIVKLGESIRPFFSECLGRKRVVVRYNGENYWSQESISPVNKPFYSSGESGSVTVVASSSCSWTATSNDPSWISITFVSRGVMNGTVSYSVLPNTSAGSRTGTITIEGERTLVLTVTQAGTNPFPDIKANDSDEPITLGDE